MIRKSMVVVAAVGGVGLGVVAVGPAAGAPAPNASGKIRIAGVSPRAFNAPHLIIKSRDPHARLARGDIFAGQKYDLGPAPSGSAIGPDIVDDHGRQIYFMNHSQPGDRATEVREQTYNGQPVFTYWYGHTGANPGIGEGNDHILNEHYQTVKVVRAQGTLDGKRIYADQHEFQLTPGGTALITCYALTRINANRYRPQGDTSDRSKQLVYDSIAEEIDVATGKLLHEWRALTHVSPAQSHQPLPTDTNGKPDQNIPWDYFHINAVKLDKDRNLIISGRHTWAIYKVNRHHGNIMWQLQSGNHTTGPKSDFKIGSGAAFAWQHDPEPLGNNEYRIFDNNWNQVPTTPKGPAHVLIVKLDLVHHTATNMGHINYSGPTMYAGSQGNSQTLPANHVFIGWGAGSDFTEVNANRQQVWDAEYEGAGFNSYRAYKAPWVGTPRTQPSISMHSPGGRKQADVVWNGANTVARYRILCGPSRSKLASIGTTRWRGLDTAFRLSSYRAYIKAVALDSRGRVLGRTAAIHT